jgi:type I restriction enzyme S subunit
MTWVPPSQVTGVTSAGILKQLLRALQVPLPSREEQNEIIRRVEALFAYADRLEACYTAARAQVERLIPALLAKAFRGELVLQDPNHGRRQASDTNGLSA